MKSGCLAMRIHGRDRSVPPLLAMATPKVHCDDSLGRGIGSIDHQLRIHLQLVRNFAPCLGLRAHGDDLPEALVALAGE